MQQSGLNWPEVKPNLTHWTFKYSNKVQILSSFYPKKLPSDKNWDADLLLFLRHLSFNWEELHHFYTRTQIANAEYQKPEFLTEHSTVAMISVVTDNGSMYRELQAVATRLNWQKESDWFVVNVAESIHVRSHPKFFFVCFERVSALHPLLWNLVKYVKSCW